MYNLLIRIFDGAALVIDGLFDRVSAGWRHFADGPLQGFLFHLILTISGIIVLFKAAFQEVDRLVAGLEKTFISIALLAMTALSFLDYLRREMPGFDFEIQGGPNMAVVLMVWVGFLGASLATRRRKHLAVDATDRILSPKAARIAKRFTAFIAAGFCWKFVSYATAMVDESLAKGQGQDALPLWDWLVEPVNAISAAVLAPAGLSMGVIGGASVLLCGSVYRFRKWGEPDEDAPIRPERVGLNVVAAIAVLVLGCAVLSAKWNPTALDGEAYVWEPITTESATSQKSAEELRAIDATLDALVGDTGLDEDSDGGAPASITELLESSAGGEKFPLWLAQAVIPLSFILMAARFLFLGLFGTFRSENELPPPTTLEPSTGRGARDLLFAGLIPGILIGLGAAVGVGIGKLILIGAILLIFIGAPLFLTIGIAAIACVVLIQDYNGSLVAIDMYEAVKKEELLAIPFFVLAGNIMTEGAIAERLVGVARAVMGKTPGGLGIASIFACVIFAAISGSSPVTVIAVGGIMFPMLVRERYPENYSIGVLTSAGSLGIIIPPSVPMIVYAIMVSNQDQQVSPNDLFIAGVLPGLFIALILITYTLYQTRPTKPDVDILPVEYDGSYGTNLRREVKRSILSMMLPVLILGGIYGILGPIRFTVTEAAAVAVVYALFVELVVHREMKFRDLPRVLADSGVMMGSLFLIIVLAIAFNKFLAEQYIPQNAAAWLGDHIDARWQFLILVNLFLLAIGCVMDIISAILIVAPLLAPIAARFGIDPIHFGIMFIVNLELGYLTPPMGINLFVSSTVFKRPIVQVIRACVPFLLLMLFCLAVIVWVPSLSLALL